MAFFVISSLFRWYLWIDTMRQIVERGSMRQSFERKMSRTSSLVMNRLLPMRSGAPALNLGWNALLRRDEGGC